MMGYSGLSIKNQKRLKTRMKTIHNDIKYVNMKIRYVVISLGAKHNEMKALQMVLMDLQT
jgi:hypothetical protein